MSVLVGLSRSAEGAAALARGAEEAALRGEALEVVEMEDGAVGAVTLPAGASVLPGQEHQDRVQVLLDACASREVVLLVIGTRRRTSVGKFLLGSQAQRVLLEADVPVLVVKAPR